MRLGKRILPKYGKLPPALDTNYLPWEVIQVDLFGPWAFTEKSGKDRFIHAVSIIDPATRWTELHLLKKVKKAKLSFNVAKIIDRDGFFDTHLHYDVFSQWN